MMRISRLTETHEDQLPATIRRNGNQDSPVRLGINALGPIASWPADLRRTVEMMLSCGFPCTLQWGEQGILMYNDAYIPLIGPRHPSALGQPIFAAFLKSSTLTSHCFSVFGMARRWSSKTCPTATFGTTNLSIPGSRFPTVLFEMMQEQLLPFLQLVSRLLRAWLFARVRSAIELCLRTLTKDAL